ncbi:MAG: hypothetical protein ACRD0P_09260, partial [Stackebrandtia sp.]
IYTPSAWYSGSEDSWARFGAEQQWVIDQLDAHGWSDRVFIVQGDVHALGLDTGTHTPGGIPVLQASAMDSWSGGPGSRWDTGPSEPGGDQYGTVRIRNTGDIVEVTMSAWRKSERRRNHVFAVPGERRPPATDVTVLDLGDAVGKLTARLENAERRYETALDHTTASLAARDSALRYLALGAVLLALIAIGFAGWALLS